MTAAASLDFFARSVRERLFVPQPDERRRIGVELELLPRFSDTRLPCPLGMDGAPGRNTLAIVRRHATEVEWREHRSSKGAPYFTLPSGATLTFEPGGQLELCTPPRVSIGALLSEIESSLAGLRVAAADDGVELLSVGIDPENPISAVPLQIESDRYLRMTRYLETIGPSGPRMMRQTAATQVSLDPGADPGPRWRLLCDLTPYLTAMFANSPRYAGMETGYASFRARCWRLLDPSRTGVPEAHLPAHEAYTRFALDAVDMWRPGEPDTYRPFVDWVAEGTWTEGQWENHLSTLFPEVRPRGYLEVRSIDALATDMLAAPVVLLAGLVYDAPSAAEARRLLPAADDDLLNRAALCGLRDSEIAERAADLVTLGLRGARAVGEGIIDGETLEMATQFFSDRTLQRRSPGDSRQA
jgi:glutamate--cysteine ligase